MNIAGIEYEKPTAILLQDSGVGVAEYAARTCYDSFENSENECVKEFNRLIEVEEPNEYIFAHTKNDLNRIDSSDLLSSLAWVHHHHSIIEHATVSYLVKGTSRGVLQEHARHRIQAISVRSTRYTMQNILYMFISCFQAIDGKNWFINKIRSTEMFVVKANTEILEISHMYEKLLNHMIVLGKDNFTELMLSKTSLKIYEQSEGWSCDQLLNKLITEGKSKRNVGDPFKYLVTDNWKVDMVVTFNIRSLKNYFDLRDSGAAWFQIQWLAEAMKEVTPVKYLKLIDKKYKTL